MLKREVGILEPFQSSINHKSDKKFDQSTPDTKQVPQNAEKKN